MPVRLAAAREVVVFGAPATVVLLPLRSQRADRPGSQRPAFAPGRADRIVAEEALWRGDGLAATPNRFPFLRDQRILWPTRPAREPDRALWLAAHEWVAAANGTGLLNSIGGAASIARAHVHLSPERLSFLAALPLRPVAAGKLGVAAGVELRAADLPFCLLALRGPAPARSDALLQLAEERFTAAWNVVIDPEVSWVYPRSLETPAPDFPHALGAAELAGRWCHATEATFAAATGAMMERALVNAGMPPL